MMTTLPWWQSPPGCGAAGPTLPLACSGCMNPSRALLHPMHLSVGRQWTIPCQVSATSALLPPLPSPRRPTSVVPLDFKQLCASFFSYEVRIPQASQSHWVLLSTRQGGGGEGCVARGVGVGVGGRVGERNPQRAREMAAQLSSPVEDSNHGFGILSGER